MSKPWLALLPLLAACPPPEAPPPHPLETRWLPAEDEGERARAIEAQFAGFSQTMWEVGHRHAELHRAVADGNTAYATYQLEHIAEAIELGILRRPGRAENARPFLDQDIPAMQQALDAAEPEATEAALARLTEACQSCHVAEDVAFIPVQAVR